MQRFAGDGVGEAERRPLDDGYGDHDREVAGTVPRSDSPTEFWHRPTMLVACLVAMVILALGLHNTEKPAAARGFPALTMALVLWSRDCADVLRGGVRAAVVELS